MKDITSTLRRIDEEINGTRQQIAALQVNIIRLEDARRVLMGIAEADQMKHAGHGEALLLDGAQAEIVVRKIGRPNGKVGKRHGRNLAEGRKRRAAILEMLAEGPLTSTAINERMGLYGDVARKPVQNALSNMKAAGLIVRGEDGYALPEPGQ